ncbi:MULTISPECIES: DUF5988 family protein [unclassified Streptomyces]|uniref:DUF5988 family protein n=1 Tax=unclassified Streptomyces TaxID=2593676 RepID=UPI00332C106A
MENPNVILTGGPTFLIHEKDRVRYVADRDSKVKVLSGNRYEHFEPTDETVVADDQELQVFAWSGCTYVAE